MLKFSEQSVFKQRLTQMRFLARMSLTEIPLRLPTDILNALRTLAQSENMKVNDLIHAILANEVLKHADAKGHGLHEADVMAALRLRLAPLLQQADDLDGLNWALKELGYVLRQDGDGYALLTWPVHKLVCNASDLGLSKSRMKALDPDPDSAPVSGWPLAHALRNSARKSA